MHAQELTQKVETRTEKHIPQFKVRAGLRGGESLDACQKNLDYWKKIYNNNLKLAQEKADWF